MSHPHSVTVTVNPQVVPIGTPFTYTLEVTSLGPNAATNVVLTDTLPPGLEIVSVNGSPCTTSGQTVTCSFGPLSPADKRTVTITVRATLPGNYVNKPAVSADNDDVLYNNEDSVPNVVFTPTCGLADRSFTSYKCALGLVPAC